MIYIYLADVAHTIAVASALTGITSLFLALFCICLWYEEQRKTILAAVASGVFGVFGVLLLATAALFPTKEGIYLMVGHSLATQTGTYAEAGETLSLINKYIKKQLTEVEANDLPR